MEGGEITKEYSIGRPKHSGTWGNKLQVGNPGKQIKTYRKESEKSWIHRNLYQYCRGCSNRSSFSWSQQVAGAQIPETRALSVSEVAGVVESGI